MTNNPYKIDKKTYERLCDIASKVCKELGLREVIVQGHVTYYYIDSSVLDLDGEIVRIFPYEKYYEGIVFFNKLKSKLNDFDKLHYVFNYDKREMPKLLKDYDTNIIPFNMFSYKSLEDLKTIILNCITQKKKAELEYKREQISKDF